MICGLRRGENMLRRFCLALSLLSCAWAQTSIAADAGAGKALAQSKCAACHEPADWDGETEASLQSLIKDVVSGKVKHSKTKVELNDQEIANVAAYWLSASKGKGKGK
jgi:mono/diheme cytochrome c family protein